MNPSLGLGNGILAVDAPARGERRNSTSGKRRPGAGAGDAAAQIPDSDLPPSTGRTAPVMNRASLLIRKLTASTTASTGGMV